MFEIKETVGLVQRKSHQASSKLTDDILGTINKMDKDTHFDMPVRLFTNTKYPEVMVRKITSGYKEKQANRKLECDFIVSIIKDADKKPAYIRVYRIA